MLRRLKPESLEAFGKDGFHRDTPTLQVSKPNPAQRKHSVGSNNFEKHSIRRLRWSSAIEKKKGGIRHQKNVVDELWSLHPTFQWLSPLRWSCLDSDAGKPLKFRLHRNGDYTKATPSNPSKAYRPQESQQIDHRVLANGFYVPDSLILSNRCQSLVPRWVALRNGFVCPVDVDYSRIVTGVQGVVNARAFKYQQHFATGQKFDSYACEFQFRIVEAEFHDSPSFCKSFEEQSNRKGG
jgi:hypothetical protein